MPGTFDQHDYEDRVDLDDCGDLDDDFCGDCNARRDAAGQGRYCDECHDYLARRGAL